MAVPKLDTEHLTLELNKYRRTGELLTNAFVIRKLTNIIEKVGDDAAYHSYMSSLLCLQGDFSSARNHALEVVKNYDFSYRANSVVTLLASGFFTEARNIYDIYQSNQLHEVVGQNDLLSNLARTTFSFGFVREILTYPDPNQMKISIELTDEILEILKSNNISEQTVLEMLDHAGTTLRSHHMFFPRGMEIVSNIQNNTINISFPLSISAKEVVKLEWEFLNELHTKMPNAPSSTIHVGFSCVATNAD